MSRTSALILLGILTALTPFSGLPVALRSLLAVVFGACVFGIGFAMRHEHVLAATQQHTPDAAPAEESTPPQMSSI